MDAQLAAVKAGVPYDAAEALEFTFEALRRELQVGLVYVRVYNEQPEFRIPDPRGFSANLLVLLQ